MKYLFFVITLCFILTNFSSAQQTPIRISGYIQGTTYSIVYFDKENRDFNKEIEQILKDFDKSCSMYDSVSIISKINRNVPNIIVDNYFKICFNKAQEVSKATNGAFDITVGPIVNAWGFGYKNKQKVDSLLIIDLLKYVGYNKVILKDNIVVKEDAHIIIDFNALAQGYSVDVVRDFLISKNILSFIIEIGGEVYAKDKKPNGDNWKVGIEKPSDNRETKNELKAIANIENKALATSGNYRKFYIENGIRYSHTINPKTGFPAKNSLLSATVIADDCISADAYATSFMVMGIDKSIEFLKIHPEIQAYLIYSDDNGNFKTFETEGLKNIILEK